jgi:hypothetical protein
MLVLPDGSYLALIFTPGLPAAQRQTLQAQAKAGQPIDGDLARVMRWWSTTFPTATPTVT